MSPLIRFGACTLLLLLTACGDETTEPDNPVLGCENTNHTCVDFGSAFSQAEAADHCDGDVLQGPCSPTNSVGSCQVDVGGFFLTEYYYTTGWSEMTAEAECTDNGGTWN